MRGWKDGYNTRGALTTAIKKVISKAHGLDIFDILVTWESQWKEVKFPTGLIQKTGKATVRADGFVTKSFCIFQSKDCKWEMR